MRFPKDNFFVPTELYVAVLKDTVKNEDRHHMEEVWLALADVDSINVLLRDSEIIDDYSRRFRYVHIKAHILECFVANQSRKCDEENYS